jgi:dual specificity tyrosine-phosphorylation-regulated kinase 2/3/4
MVFNFCRKPENILLCAQPPSRGNQASYESMSCKVKLVDFGNAMTPEDASAYFDDFQVQSLYYRAPEVLLGSWNFSYAIDMWSLGCVLAELYIGRPLFRVRSSSELFVNMQQVLGPLPAGVFTSSKFYSKYVVDPSFEVTCFSRLEAKLL